MALLTFKPYTFGKILSTSTPDPKSPSHCTSDVKAEICAAGLRYVMGSQPGIRHERRGEGFRYHAPDDTVVEAEATITRLKALAIPPACDDVWV